MQGFNMGRYFPPSFRPDRDKTLNKLAGKHALGDRARKLKHGGGLIVWCEGCNNHIGQGVRYNAEKIREGAYHSTPIWSFKCKCHLCDNYFVIRTDPQNSRFVVVEGARQQWDLEDGKLETREVDVTGATVEVDPLAAVEKDKQDRVNALTAAGHIAALADVSEDQWADPYERSRKLRDHFRKDKHARAHRQKGDDALRERLGLSENVKLEEESEQTIRQASKAWQDQRRLAAAVENPDRAKRRRIEAEVGSSTRQAPSTAANKLAQRILTNTRHGADPFLAGRTPQSLPTLAQPTRRSSSSSSLGITRR